METEKAQIDQNALSRQLAVYGHETQGKLMAMRVLIHGLTGVFLIIIHIGWCRSRKELNFGRS